MYFENWYFLVVEGSRWKISSSLSTKQVWSNLIGRLSSVILNGLVSTSWRKTLSYWLFLVGTSLHRAARWCEGDFGALFERPRSVFPPCHCRRLFACNFLDTIHFGHFSGGLLCFKILSLKVFCQCFKSYSPQR